MHIMNIPITHYNDIVTMEAEICRLLRCSNSKCAAMHTQAYMHFRANLLNIDMTSISEPNIDIRNIDIRANIDMTSISEPNIDIRANIDMTSISEPKPVVGTTVYMPEGLLLKIFFHGDNRYVELSWSYADATQDLT
jgi:hypothetical protein